MLVPYDMKELIKQKMQYGGYPITQEDSNERMSKGIGEYLASNTELSYSWIAQTTSSPPTPDPIVSFNTSLSYNNTNIELFSTKSQFYSNLSLFIFSSLSIITPTGWLLDLVFNPTGFINFDLTSDLDTFDKAMLAFCTNFISSFKSSYINPTPIIGNRTGTYFGQAVMLSII
jgi:hypothetical protein